MRIWVQKFGGTSLSGAEARSHAIGHIRRALEEQVGLVVVVSAMGRRGEPYATDTLLDFIRANGDSLPARETDMLLHCGELIAAATLCSLLAAADIPSTVLTGAQAGIRTNENFGNASIERVDPARIREELGKGRVVIVPGFQGAAANGDTTTLGRGGSDTTATALGAALQAEFVDIFTDVEGILTADPRVVKDAKPLAAVGYAEICHMAYNGAKVIHPRAVEIAMQAGVPIRVRSTFADGPGTLVADAETIRRHEGDVRDRPITGIAHAAGMTHVQVTAREGQYDLHVKVFKTMATHKISVDFINVNPAGVAYTVFRKDKEKALSLLGELGFEAASNDRCAKVSVIGGGMNGVPGIMATIVEALADQGIPILQCADSHTTIWVLVEEARMEDAVRALHHKFSLHA